MTVLPIDQSPEMLKAVQVTQLVRTAGPAGILTNPILAAGNTLNSRIGSARSTLTGYIAATTGPALGKLQRLQASLGTLGGQSSSLVTHANRLIFGDENGDLIRGGITRNAGQALRAINLNDTLGRAAGTPPPADPCGLMRGFFGTILGAGAALLAKAQALMAQVEAAIAQGVQVIQDGINAVLAIANQITAEIQAVVAEIANQISREIAAFAQWLQNQINFATGRFFAGFMGDPCFKAVASAVGTPALHAILGS